MEDELQKRESVANIIELQETMKDMMTRVSDVKLQNGKIRDQIKHMMKFIGEPSISPPLLTSHR
ncbi:hypothetical protein PROFUN_03436 [Planoprotostelium fungivorum]|uniref:Uncharacterized protein n=1 Tax=Planoprotostelium fungivorum TaxID=1890364 RepID=A0A2P6NWI5_9EUKA|nr:hypothetical protein PROFUN_03436 [Planoprotostelium fungivorum]